jgi:SAM-dependent methyltransferase
MWFKTLSYACKRNGWRQLFFYLSNLDIWRFMEYEKIYRCVNEVKSKGKIVDLGSGYSVFPAFFKGTQYRTLDLSEAACGYQRSFGIDAVQADMTRMPLESGSISVVVAISSLEHVPDDWKVFREIARVLEEGGTAFIAVPYSKDKTVIHSMKKPRWQTDLLHRYKKLWRILLGKVHLNYFLEQIETDAIMRCYNLPDLQRMAQESGLSVAGHEFIGGRNLVCAPFRLLPVGWCVLKDLLIGWPLYRLEQLIYKNERPTGEILLTLRKRVLH